MTTATAESPQHDQRLAALEIGNAKKRAWTARKRTIAALPMGEGCKAVADLIHSPPEDVLPKRLGVLLCCIHRVSEGKLDSIMGGHESLLWVSVNAKVETLTYRQRAALVLLLRERAGA